MLSEANIALAPPTMKGIAAAAVIVPKDGDDEKSCVAQNQIALPSQVQFIETKWQWQ
jgi:hypothetical protein